MKGTLIKRFSTHNNLRTNEVAGEFEALPAVGKRFIMLAPPLEAGHLRQLVTTEVLNTYQVGHVISFCTQNSVYELRLEAS